MQLNQPVTNMTRTQTITAYSILGAFFLAALGLATYMTSVKDFYSFRPQAANQYTLQSYTLTDTSRYQEASKATFFDLASQTKEKGLYELPEISAEAALAFLAKKPLFSLTSNAPAQPLIPDTAQNLRLRTSFTDSQLDADLAERTPDNLNLQNLDTQSTHFYFDQTRCNGVPVFGAYVQMHVSKTADVYAMSAALVEGDTKCKETLSRAQTEQKAITAYAKMFSAVNTTARSTEPSIYAPQLFGESDTNQYLTDRVTVCGEEYCHAYFVDKADGSIHHDYPISTDAKNRYVFLGSAQRKENASPVGNTDVNKAYDIMGVVWDHYNSAYQRDSYDNRGGLIQVRLGSCSQIQASWNGTEIYSCNAIADTDVLAHEFQHGVTQYTAGLVYQSESGAMNEGFSDIFASVIDKDDWLMGEEGIRPIRSLQNPHQFNHPETTVESQYVCGSSDNGGVHTNSGVINKAFYLMSDGGTHSGCTMTGIGRDAAGQIMYKALTVYLNGKTTAGYQEAYTAINQACADIHGASSAQCANVKAAMESTYMDKPNRCKGGSSSGGATCSGATQPPIPPGNPTTAPTQAPSGAPTQTPPTATPTPPGGQTQQVPTPTPGVPTPAPEVVKEAPLLSTKSSPKFLSGSVKLTKEGTQSVFKATLESASLQSLNISNLTERIDEMRGRFVGADVVETGSFVSQNGLYVNEFKTTKDLSQYAAYEIYFAQSTSAGELPIFIADMNVPAPTGQPESNLILDLALRFQGITRKPPSTEAQLVRVGLSGGTIDGILYKKAVFTPDSTGVWHGRVSFSDVNSMTDATIRIKGARHTQKKYCDAAPVEKAPGEYLCKDNVIALSKGINTLDFTGVVQLAGDVNQDGRVNSVDINLIRTHIGSIKPEDLTFGDMNNDGVINSMDDAMAVYTLSNRAEQ